MTDGKPERFVRLADALRVPRQRKASSSRPLKIYALVDPRDRTVRYVGVTNKAPDARLDRHLKYPTNWRLARWMGELRTVGAPAPEISVIEYVSKAEWQDAERGWIYWFRQRGELLNIDIGGIHRHASGAGKGRFVAKYLPPKAVIPKTKASKRMPRGTQEMRRFISQGIGSMEPRIRRQGTLAKDPVAGHASNGRYDQGEPRREPV